MAVSGPSMEPTLRPGDWLLVDPDAFRQRRPVAGDLAVVPDPRSPERLVIKRVGSVGADGRLTVLGDAPEASTDSRAFGPVLATSVIGRPWFRYWPLGRIGRVR